MDIQEVSDAQRSLVFSGKPMDERKPFAQSRCGSPVNNALSNPGIPGRELLYRG
jgi:hypothetical protein